MNVPTRLSVHPGGTTTVSVGDEDAYWAALIADDSGAASGDARDLPGDTAQAAMTPTVGDQGEVLDALELEVRHELRQLAVREEARRRHRAGQASVRLSFPR